MIVGKSKIFFWILGSFVGGTGIASFFQPTGGFVLFILFFGFVLLLVVGFSRSVMRILGFCGIGFLVGVWRFLAAEPVIDQYHVAFYHGEKVRLVGVVSKEPETKRDYQRIVMDVRELEVKEDQRRRVQGQVFFTAGRYPEIEYGDRLELACELKFPQHPDGFGYKKLFTQKEILSVCFYPKVKRILGPRESSVRQSLFLFKRYLIETTDRMLPEPHASFLSGLLFGAKRQIPENLQEDFLMTGTSHIVVLSGYNITAVSLLFLNLLRHFLIPRKAASGIALFAIFLFILMTGAEASSVRAGIMGSLGIFARLLGRLSSMGNTMIAAAAVMVFMEPKILLYNLGFELSFLATIGLFTISPLLREKFKFLPAFFSFRDSVVTTIAATLMTLPLILFSFGRISTVSILTNALILPLIPPAMAVGFSFVLLSSVLPSLGEIVILIPWMILSIIIGIIRGMAGFPFASWDISSIPWILMVGMYGGIAFWIMHDKREAREI